MAPTLPPPEALLDELEHRLLLKLTARDRGKPERSSKERLLAFAGRWKDDPTLDEMLRDVYKRRGRPMTEEGE